MQPVQDLTVDATVSRTQYRFVLEDSDPDELAEWTPKLAEALSLTVDELDEILKMISQTTLVALDELWTVSDSSGDQVSLLDTIEDRDAPDPEQSLNAGDVRDQISAAIADLPEREKVVIALYYYEGLTLREIGEVLGVTESRICQIHSQAISRLRSKLRDW